MKKNAVDVISGFVAVMMILIMLYGWICLSDYGLHDVLIAILVGIHILTIFIAPYVFIIIALLIPGIVFIKTWVIFGFLNVYSFFFIAYFVLFIIVLADAYIKEKKPFTSRIHS